MPAAAEPARVSESHAGPGAGWAPVVQPRYDALDAVRGVAAIFIVVYHAGIVTSFDTLSPLGGVVARLAVGVPLFFALSGFLLYRPFVAARSQSGGIAVRRFYLRRILRIVPAYWAVIAAVLIVPGLVAENPALDPLRSGDLWRYALFVQVYFEDSAPYGIGQAWTLCVELAFYLLLPLLAAFAARLPGFGWELTWLVALALASLSIRMIGGGEGYPVTSVSIVGTFAWLSCGMVLAVLSVRAERERRAGPSLAWCWLAAAAIYGSCVWALPRAVVGPYSDLQYGAEHMGYLMISFFVLAPLVIGAHRAGITRIASWRAVRWLGAVSYGVYLWHVIVLSSLRAHGALTWNTGSPMLVVSLLAIGGALVLGTASYAFVERPALRFARRRSSARVIAP